MTAANDLAVRRALEAAGVEFIDGNGGAQVCGSVRVLPYRLSARFRGGKISAARLADKVTSVLASGVTAEHAASERALIVS